MPVKVVPSARAITGSKGLSCAGGALILQWSLASWRKLGELKINPPEDEAMPEGARVVALADDGTHTHKGMFAVADKETGMASHT